MRCTRCVTAGSWCVVCVPSCDSWQLPALVLNISSGPQLAAPSPASHGPGWPGWPGCCLRPRLSAHKSFPGARPGPAQRSEARTAGAGTSRAPGHGQWATAGCEADTELRHGERETRERVNGSWVTNTHPRIVETKWQLLAIAAKVIWSADY